MVGSCRRFWNLYGPGKTVSLTEYVLVSPTPAMFSTTGDPDLLGDVARGEIGIASKLNYA